MGLRRSLRPIAHAVRSIVGTRGLDDRLKTIEAALHDPPPPPPVESQGLPEPALDINLVLHQSRAALMRAMPPRAQRLLSAGCAGTWYFDWIEQTYGRVPEHLGIEYYSPEPVGLPANVRWIANSASDMSGVATESCDLVFSGQNLEHLWPEEVCGFLLEAARVLRPGGHVVIDSPNRLVTAALNWSHPEHTLELTVDEMAGLLTLAGFDVTKTRGIWLCRDPRSGTVLPFDPNAEVDGWSLVERLAVAGDEPANSFIWWMEARRADRPPDAAAVRDTMARLFRTYWPERVQRFQVPEELTTEADAEGSWVRCDPDYGHVALFGPFMALRAGHYRATWRFRTPEAGSSLLAFCEVVGGAKHRVLVHGEVRSGMQQVSLAFHLAATTFNMQFRCGASAGGGFSVLRHIELVQDDEPAATPSHPGQAGD